MPSILDHRAKIASRALASTTPMLTVSVIVTVATGHPSVKYSREVAVGLGRFPSPVRERLVKTSAAGGVHLQDAEAPLREGGTAGWS